MNSNGSFLGTLITRIRGYLDDPDVDAKYTDDYLLRHIIMPAYVDVLARLNLGRDEAPVLGYSVTVVQGTKEYVLPPCVQEVVRLVTVDSSGNVIFDIMPLGLRNPLGPQWRIEGNILVIDPLPNTALNSNTLRIDYITNGDFFPFYSTTSGPLSESTTGGGYDTLRLPATPTLGQVDQRPNAYAGGWLRLIPTSGQWEERQIEESEYSGGNWSVRVRKPFTTVTAYTGPIEIAPAGSQPLYEGIATAGAMKLGTYRKITQAQMEMIKTQHLMAMKSIKDNLANINLRRGRGFDKGTVDNERYQGLRI